MLQSELIHAALQQTIEAIPESPGRRRYAGKVRDIFEMPGDRLAIAVILDAEQKKQVKEVLKNAQSARTYTQSGIANDPLAADTRRRASGERF